jgi:hypothetical protein
LWEEKVSRWSVGSSRKEAYRLDGNTLGVNGAEVGVLKEGDEISLNRFLQSSDLFFFLLVIRSPERIRGFDIQLKIGIGDQT